MSKNVKQLLYGKSGMIVLECAAFSKDSLSDGQLTRLSVELGLFVLECCKQTKFCAITWVRPLGLSENAATYIYMYCI